MSLPDFSFKLSDFEGPLDLILSLISQHKMNIFDIDISLLLSQYLDRISDVGEDMDGASEFLEMGARLVYMKSLMLLPRSEEEGRDLKKELEGQLIEYQLCKTMAAKLAEQNAGFMISCRPPLALEADKSYERIHDPRELLAAYASLSTRKLRFAPPPRESFDPIVAAPPVSVASRIASILRRLYRTGCEKYAALFRSVKSRSEAVATFLALLELMKERRVAMDDKENVRFVSNR